MECWEELHGVSRGDICMDQGGTIHMECQGGLYAWSIKGTICMKYQGRLYMLSASWFYTHGVRGDYMHGVSGETIHVECQWGLYA